MRLLLCAAIVALAACAARAAEPPTTATQYSVSGAIHLPYANLTEPFTVYFDAPGQRERVEYYGGVNVVLTRVAENRSDEIVPVGGVEGSTTTCFAVDGPTQLTDFFPNPSGFEQQPGTTSCGPRGSLTCTVYVKTVTTLGRQNVYSYYWSNDGDGVVPFPVALNFVGYDELLGSHYDEYRIDYTDYNPSPVFKDSQFVPPSNLTCGDFPGPGAQRVDAMAQLRRVIHGDDAASAQEDGEFAEFADKHGRGQYGGDKLAARRARHNYMHNARLVAALNRRRTRASDATFALNHLADLSAEEMAGLRGRRGYLSGGDARLADNGASSWHADDMTAGLVEIPPAVDWRTQGAVSAVKDQAVCGSCWSFATTGTIEGQLFLFTGVMTNLSQQELIDCSWDQGNNGCDGGEDFRAYRWIIESGGLLAANDYGDGQYKFADFPCRVNGNGRSNNPAPSAKLRSYVNVTNFNVTALKAALATVGPISVSIDASHQSFGFYSSGVYYEPACKSGLDDLDHAVLAVGYGTEDGQDYFIVKNSWSTHWGDEGFIKMSAKDNNCGVASVPTYPQLTG